MWKKQTFPYKLVDPSVEECWADRMLSERVESKLPFLMLEACERRMPGAPHADA